MGAGCGAAVVVSEAARGARNPVESVTSPLGETMSLRGPAEAWARGMSPAAWSAPQVSLGTGPPERESGADTHLKLDDRDPKVLINHRMQPDRRLPHQLAHDLVRLVHPKVDLLPDAQVARQVPQTLHPRRVRCATDRTRQYEPELCAVRVRRESRGGEELCERAQLRRVFFLGSELRERDDRDLFRVGAGAVGARERERREVAGRAGRVEQPDTGLRAGSRGRAGLSAAEEEALNMRARPARIDPEDIGAGETGSVGGRKEAVVRELEGREHAAAGDGGRVGVSGTAVANASDHVGAEYRLVSA